MTQTQNPDVELVYEIEGGIGTITFNRPQARNALTFAMYNGLKDICASISDNASVKALVITGAGDRAFAAGTDINQFRDLKTEEQATAYEANIDAVLGALESCPIPTIASISGACTGGGAAIAAACDIRIATQDLKFGFPIARTLGNCLSAANLNRLSSLMGAGRVKEMIFSSRFLGAEECLSIGLVSELLADHAALNARTKELAELLVEQAPLTLRATKEAMRRLQSAAPVEDKDLITLCYTSEDFHEGLDAFLGKRKPHWQGK